MNHTPLEYPIWYAAGSSAVHSNQSILLSIIKKYNLK